MQVLKFLLTAYYFGVNWIDNLIIIQWKVPIYSCLWPVSLNISFKKEINNGSDNKEQAFHFAEDDWDGESTEKQIHSNSFWTHASGVHAEI